ncbi:MAG: adenylosuccinate lyase [Ktedonobacterales bacterium]|jgi:adenylosuccinate lyase|nr:MAG: adenylosuccinate lyase [Ktedonobacterales bacterium]
MIERYTRPEMARIWSDENKLDTWLRVEILVCEGWAREGVISPEDMEKIRAAAYDLDRAHELEREIHHDVISFLRSVQEGLGPEGRFLHLGLTSSDVLDTALAVQLLQAGSLLREALDTLLETVSQAAVRYRETLMVGRTHGIHAEPTTFGFKLAMWVDELRRARTRLDAAIDDIAVGAISGAVGTHATVPPQIEEYVCGQLGLRPAPVSTQIIQRDRHAHYVTTLALIGASLDKMALELRHLQRTELGEAFEPFGANQQGSSAMPHKRNPEKAERVTGLARVLRGYAVTAMENVALWHERDISHSSAERMILPDATATLHYMLWLFNDMMAGLEVDAERMRANLDLTRGLIYSSRILLALVDSGMDRQEAYKLVQRNAQKVWRNEDQGTGLLAMLKADPDVTAHLTPDALDAIADPHAYLTHIDTAFIRLNLL